MHTNKRSSAFKFGDVFKIVGKLALENLKVEKTDLILAWRKLEVSNDFIYYVIVYNVPQIKPFNL